MQAMGDLYFKVARASQEMGFAQKDNLQVTETVSKALAIGGASAQEAEATILQLGQALGSGRLQGDELRSLDENASILMGHVAKYFKTNVAGLKQMGAQGELTSDEVMRAILSASGEIDKEFSKMPMTFGQSMNMMKNSWDRFILGVEQKSNIFSFIARAFTKAFDNMGNKLHDVLTLLGSPDANKMVTITEAETGEQKQISETDYYNQKAKENPALFQAIQGFKKLGEMFDNLDGKSGNLDEQIGGVIETLMKIGMVVVPILAVIGMIDALIVLLSPFITLVTSIGSTIMGVLSPILSVGLAPLLAILGAIASVIYFVGENWETVVSWFKPGIDSIMEGIEQLKQAWESLQPFITAIMPLLQAIATVVGGAIVGALSLLFRIAAWVFKQIAGFINWVAGLLGDLGNTIQWLADGLSGLLGKAAELLGYKGKLNGMNADITNKWMSQGSGGNNNTVTQNNSFTFTNPNQYAPVAQNLGNGLISQFD
jgi:tape measure domain-containing protein